MTGCEIQRPADPPIVLARVRKGLPLVDVICQRVHNQYGVSVRLEDLVSRGREGLLAAARSFDTRLGVSFRRWANIRVRGAVIDGMRVSAGLPRSVYQRMRAAEAATRAEKVSSEDETAAEHWTPEDADRWLAEYLAGAATAIALGLGRSALDAEDGLVDRAPGAEERLLEGELWTAIRDAMSELPHLERALLERLYFEGESLEEAAAQLGVSKSWASRLHSRAVRAVTRSLKRSRCF